MSANPIGIHKQDRDKSGDCNNKPKPTDDSLDILASRIGRLTGKEQQALEMVYGLLSSKEIGLILGLSRKTVDQRLDNARAKLGAPTRNAAARLYMQSRDTPERFPYAPFPVSEPLPSQPNDEGVETDAVYTFSDSLIFKHELPWDGQPTSGAPEFWALRMGALPRFVLVLAGAISFLVLALLGLSLSEGASALIQS